MHFKSWLPELRSPSAHFSHLRPFCMWTMGICGDFRTSEALDWEVYLVFEQRVSLCPVLFFVFLCPAPFICFSVQCHRLLILFPEWLRRWNHHITLWWVRQTLQCSPMKVITWASKGRAQRLDWDLIKKERRLTEGIKLCTWLCFMLFLCYYMFLSATEATPLFSAPYWNTLYERVATKALLLHQWWIMS